MPPPGAADESGLACLSDKTETAPHFRRGAVLRWAIQDLNLKATD
jgi:hypothetical protein